jgi:hypothetical protein
MVDTWTHKLGEHIAVKKTATGYRWQSHYKIVLLSVESTHPGIGFLGVDVIGLVFDVMIPLNILPVSVMGTEDLSDAGLEDQCGMDIRCFGCFNDGFELDTLVRKMPDHREMVFFLGILLLHQFRCVSLISVCHGRGLLLSTQINKICYKNAISGRD